MALAPLLGVAEPACWSGLRPGDYVLAWYSDDDVWHETMIAWKSGSYAAIVTPDDDRYVSVMWGDGENGPERLLPVRRDGVIPAGVGEVYRFASYPDVHAHKALLKEGYRLMEVDCRDRGVDIEGQGRIVDPTGDERELNEYFEGLFTVRRLNMKGPAAKAKAIGGRGRGGPAVVAVPPGAAAGGGVGARRAGTQEIWIVSDPAEGALIGHQVDAVSNVITRGNKALAEIDGRWVWAEKVEARDVPLFRSRVLDRLGHALELMNPGLGAAARPGGARAGLEAAGAEADVEVGDLRAQLGLGAPPGARVAAEPAAEEENDVRTLWVDYDDQGQRFKDWRKVVNESRVVVFDDAPVRGPPSCLHMMKHWERHGGNPRLWLEMWARGKNIARTERVYHELEVLIEAFYVGGTFDQLNLGCLMGYEVLARRIQTIVDAYVTDPAHPSWANAKYFSGVSSADDLVAPELRRYVTKRAKDETEIDTARGRSRILGAVVAGGLPEKKGEGGHPKKGSKKGAGKGGDASPPA